MICKTEGITFSINLNEEYSVFIISSFDYDNNRYNLTYYLKEKSTELLDKIDGDIYNSVQCTRKELKIKIDNIITKLNKRKYFDRFIDRFEYQLKCFDKGIDYYETHID